METTSQLQERKKLRKHHYEDRSNPNSWYDAHHHETNLIRKRSNSSRIQQDRTGGSYQGSDVLGQDDEKKSTAAGFKPGHFRTHISTPLKIQ